jgi:hypothetical protein
LTRSRHLFSLLGAAFAALVLSVGATCTGTTAQARAAKPHKLTKHQKTVARRQLRQALKKNPRGVLRRDFLKKAQAVDLNLPLTLRLRRSNLDPIDDELSIEWSDTSFEWPGGFAPLSPATNTDPPVGGVVPLDGTTSVEAEFGNDVGGYAGPGVVETLTGAKVDITSGAAPLAIPVTAASENPLDPHNHVAACNAPVVQLRKIQLDFRNSTQSLLHLFGGTARVTLHVQVGTTSGVLPAGDCSGNFSNAGDNAHPSLGSDPLVPIVFDPTFRISPGITADGNMRLGVLTVAATSAQPDTFARLSMCVDPTPLSGLCHTEAFPARLRLLRMNAEVLLGDVS